METETDEFANCEVCEEICEEPKRREPKMGPSEDWIEPNYWC